MNYMYYIRDCYQAPPSSPLNVMHDHRHMAFQLKTQWDMCHLVMVMRYMVNMSRDLNKREFGVLSLEVVQEIVWIRMYYNSIHYANYHI